MNQRTYRSFMLALVTTLVVSVVAVPRLPFRINTAGAANSLILQLLQDTNNWATGSQAGAMPPANFTKLAGLPDSTGLATQISTADNNKSMWCGSFGYSTSPANTTTNWATNYTGNTLATTSAPGWVNMPIAGEVTEIVVQHLNLPQATDSITYTLDVQNSASALAVTVPAGSQAVTTQTGNIPFVKGGLLGIRVNKSGTAAATAIHARISIRCKSSE